MICDHREIFRLRGEKNEINSLTREPRISHGEAIFHAGPAFHKSRKGFISLKRGCLKMIINDHERQPSFLRLAVEKLSNYFKKQRTYPEGQGLPLKKCAVYTFGDAMQQLGQSGAFPTGLFVFYDAASEGYRPCLQDTIPP